MLMNMVYKDKYTIVDGNMSDSNIVLNGVINESINKKNHGIDLQILD